MCDLRDFDVNGIVVCLDESYISLLGLFINIKFSHTICLVSCIYTKWHGFTSEKRCYLFLENFVVL